VRPAAKLPRPWFEHRQRARALRCASQVSDRPSNDAPGRLGGGDRSIILEPNRDMESDGLARQAAIDPGTIETIMGTPIADDMSARRRFGHLAVPLTFPSFRRAPSCRISRAETIKGATIEAIMPSPIAELGATVRQLRPS
jgi:hypothetical protein